MTSGQMKTTRRNGWFQNEEAELYRMFQHRRNGWFQKEEAELYRMLQWNRQNDARTRTLVGLRRWADKGARKHNLSQRRNSNTKDNCVEERLPKIWMFRNRFRQSLNEPRRLTGQVVVAEPQQGETVVLTSTSL